MAKRQSRSKSFHPDFMLDLSEQGPSPLIHAELSVRKLMLDRGINNYSQLSRFTGIPPSICRRWWQWERPMSPRQYAKILDFLGLALAIIPVEKLPKALPLGTEEMITLFGRRGNER